jgi:hypothetical protein
MGDSFTYVKGIIPQFTESAWLEDADGIPFRFADDPKTARLVAIRRLKRLAGLLIARRLEASAYTLALCWNEGPTAVILGKWANKDVRDYAERVRALYGQR